MIAEIFQTLRWKSVTRIATVTRIAAIPMIALLIASPVPRARGETLAYWRFEDVAVGQKLDAELGSTKPPFTTTQDFSGHGNALRTYNTSRRFDPPDTSGTFVAAEGLPPLADSSVRNTSCARFVGEQDFYTVERKNPDASVETAKLSQFTVEGFFKLSILSDRLKDGYQVIVGKDGRPVDRLPFQPFVVVVAGRDDRYMSRDCPSVNIIDRTGQYRTAASRKPLTKDAWYAFAATCDGSALKLFINRFDGTGYQLEAETPVDGGLIDSTGTWVVGRGMFNRRPNSWLRGDVDEIRISDKALAPNGWLAAGVKRLPPVAAKVAGAIAPPQLCARNVADPTVLLHDGVYYLYGTCDAKSFSVWSSRDLKTWEKGPTVLSSGPGVWGDSAFWAPGAIEHRGRFYLYYSTSGILPDSGGRRSARINVAVADSPCGPFKEVVSRLPLLGRAVIDPQPFIDDDGKAYLYFVADIPENNGSGEVFVVRLSDDLLSTIGEPSLCIAPSQPWEGTTWNEAPFVFRDGDTYVMMYSGEFWASANYGVGVATAPAPTGPWDKRDDNPFLCHYGGLRGTGHNCLAPAPDGSGWLTFFHAHRSQTSTARDTYVARLLVERDLRQQVQLKVVPWPGGSSTQPSAQTGSDSRADVRAHTEPRSDSRAEPRADSDAEPRAEQK